MWCATLSKTSDGILQAMATLGTKHKQTSIAAHTGVCGCGGVHVYVYVCEVWVCGVVCGCGCVCGPQQ